MKRFAWMILLAVASTVTAGTGTGYHLLKTIPLPGDKGWDYSLADSGSRRLYVTHGDQVLVVDMDANTLIGKIGPFQGIHGVALAPALGRGYISDGKAAAIICFDLKTLAVIQSIPGRDDADAITYDAFSGQVFAFNGDDQSATVIDAKSNSVVATLALGGKPEFCALDGMGMLFVNLEDKDEVLTIDTKKRKVIRHSRVAPGTSPAAMSIDVAGGNLFVGCHNKKAMVLSTATGKVKTELAIGERVDASVYDAALGMVFHSCGDGTVWAAKKRKDGTFEGMEAIPTKRGSRTMAVDLVTHHLYLAGADFEPVAVSRTAKEHGRPKMVAGSFGVMVFGMDKPKE